MAINGRGLALVLAIVIAGAASGEEVTLGVGGSIRYDTNALNRRGLHENGWQLDTAPHVLWSHVDERLRYNANYRAQYRHRLTDDQDGNWSHFLQGGGSWLLGPMTQVTWADNFSRVDRPTFFSNQAVSDPADPGTNLGANDIDTGKATTTRNLVNMSLSHQLNRRQSFVVSLNQALTRSGQSDQFDSNVLSGQAFTTYRATPRTTFDLGLTSSYTVIDGSDEQPGSRSVSLQGFGGFDYQLTPSITISARGGPTAVRTKSRAHTSGSLTVPRYQIAGDIIVLDQNNNPIVLPQPAAYAYDSCSTIDGQTLLGTFSDATSRRVVTTLQCNTAIVSGPNGEPLAAIGVSPAEVTTVRATQKANDDFTVQFFGEASITKSWRYVDASIGYRRTESPTTQSGGNTSIDSLNARIAWNPPGQWSLSLSGGWSLRRSLSDVVYNPFASRSSLGEGAVDSGLLGRDLDGNLRPIAEVNSIVLLKTSNAVDVTQWSLVGRIARRIQRNGTAAFEIRYQRQEEQGDLLTGGTTDRMVATFSIDYNLDPFEF